jgi:hypothetical protein
MIHPYKLIEKSKGRKVVSLEGSRRSYRIKFRTWIMKFNAQY